MKTLYERLHSGSEKLSVIGLGYVGMPLAIAFSKKTKTIGFDVDKSKVKLYQQGLDPTKEVGDEAIRNSTVEFTADEAKLREAKFHIVAVPTPIYVDNTPNLSYLVSASKMVGRNLTKGSIVVYESTVYPGVTEDVCVPILEKASGLRYGTDFKAGYSPERINPGDKIHKIDTIVKIVAGMDADSLEQIAKVYELVVTAGVHRVSSIKVAEATKVVENAQRDVSIAFMNELAMGFDKMGIDTSEVIQAMNTKWNALGFTPGLVGGHCIGVDPHYYIYEAEKHGVHSQLLLAGRRINEGMSKFVVDAIIKELILANKVISTAKVAVLGLTFKENCPDTRNSKVVDLISHLHAYGIEPIVVDPEASPAETKQELGINLVSIDELRGIDCVVFAVAHDAFMKIDAKKLGNIFGNYANHEKVIIDVKSMLCKEELEAQGYRYWRL